MQPSVRFTRFGLTSALLPAFMLTYDQLHSLPKIDLHRHLEGSLRLETLSEIARTHGIDLLDLPALDAESLRPHVQITNDPQNFENFLAKFTVLRHFYRSPEAVARLTYEAIVDAAADNVRYLELRFSPQALARNRGFALGEVTDWVIEATRQAMRVCDIEVGLIVTLVRHEGVAQGEAVAQVAFERADKGIIGLDLAGDEVRFPARPFRHIFDEAHRKNLGVTIHAGEWTSASTVQEALDELGAQRIGHGVRAAEDPSVLRQMRAHNATFEVCLTSNVQTGAVRNFADHPIRTLMQAGTRVTLNTDDPSVSNSSLSDEYEQAVRCLDFTYGDLCRLTFNAIDAAFLSTTRRAALRASFETLLAEPRPVSVAAD